MLSQESMERQITMSTFFAKAWAWTLTAVSLPLLGQNPCPTTKHFDQGGPIAQPLMTGFYNPSACIDLREGWDVYLTGSFLYYQASEDNLEVAIESQSSTGTFIALPIQGSVVNMDFDYQPGFKVGIGMNFNRDAWDTFLEYTRLHLTTSQSAAQPLNGHLFSLWALRALSSLTIYELSQVDGAWRLNLDLADWSLGRCFFVGKSLTFHTYFGARAAWINQRYTMTNTLLSNGTVSKDYFKTNSWAVGGRAAIHTHWMIGAGLRLYGKGSMDLLYTRYHMDVQQANPISTVAVFKVQDEHVNCVRSHVETELGMGWGSYLMDQNWHIDFEVGYDFQIFWDQNMLRDFGAIDFLGSGGKGAQGNLYLQGVIISAQLDF